MSSRKSSHAPTIWKQESAEAGGRGHSQKYKRELEGKKKISRQGRDKTETQVLLGLNW